MDKNQSRFYLDLVKGVAIFAVLWGHCVESCYYGSGLDFFENSLFQFIYSFHMPLFMLISGYLFFYSFQKRDLPELIAHRSKPLLFTVFFCGIFNYLVTTGLDGLLHGNVKVLMGGRVFGSLFSSLWFLWSVLVISFIVSVVCKKIKKAWLQIAVLLLCTVLLFFLFTPERHVFMYPYFLIGFYFAQWKDKLPRGLLRMRYASLGLYPVMLLFYEKKHFVYTTGIFCDGYPLGECLMINGFRWAIGFVGSIFILTVVELICRLVVFKLKRPIVSRGLATAGQKSLQIYALSMALLNNYVMGLAVWLIDKRGMENTLTQNLYAYNYGFCLALAVIYIVALYWLVKLLDKIKLGKILFGR